MSLDFRQIRAFDAVVRSGGFSRASREIGLTQPTLSTHIRNLERQLGVRLFDRSGRSIALTPAGEILAEYAERILRLCRESVEAVGVFEGRIRGEVHIEASTVPGEYMLPRWLSAFHTRYPEVQVTLTVNDSMAVLERIVSGEVPLGVTGLPGNHPVLESRLLCEDRVVLAARLDLLPPGAGQGLTLEDLPEIPMIRREGGSGTRIAVERALRDRNFAPEQLPWCATLGSTRAVIEGVLSGLGASFLSLSTITRELEEGRLTVLDVRGLRIRRGLYVVHNTRRTLSPAAERFRDELMEAGPNLLPEVA